LSTALAFTIYCRLIHTLGSVGTTAQAYLRVPIGVAIGMIWLDERPTPTTWIGLVCVVVGVIAATLDTKKYTFYALSKQECLFHFAPPPEYWSCDARCELRRS